VSASADPRKEPAVSQTVNEILALIEKAYSIDPKTIDPQRPLAEFGLDSLSLAELIFAVEDHFHIDYPESRTHVQTLAELAQVVDETRALVPAP
jgi:acyl carrier protein